MESGHDCKEPNRQNIRFSSYFRSEFHFREETSTENRETPFLSAFTSVFQSIELGAYLSGLATKMLYLWLEWPRLDRPIRCMRPLGGG